MNRKTLWALGLTLTATVALVSFLVSAPVSAQGKRPLKATLQPFEEVPSVSSVAGGEFRAKISGDESAIEYELSYAGLEGTVTQAHIHFGQMGVNGGISVWLCGTAALPGPAGTPPCPQAGTVSRTVTAADVIGPAGQGIAAMEFAELVEALRSGVAYANVHSTKFPGGEIRGQIK
ncbi:MAG: CHRD domain-containing protein [Acidobacteria bacterium]|nr:CHRD domain-containing protein [Acidobacteriota bacterium]